MTPIEARQLWVEGELESGQCCEQVSDGTGWHFFQCSHRAKVVENDKPYCTVHAPSYRKAKAKIRTAHWEASTARNTERVHRVACFPELLAALERAQRLFSEALPQFDWGASALDRNAIALLNEVPGEVRAAIAAAKKEAL